jgi:hypothetical protein
MITISNHAIEQYQKRTGIARSKTKIEEVLQRMIVNAVPVQMKESCRVYAIISHGFKEAKYLQHGNWILVIKENVLVTIYRPDQKQKFYFNGREHANA